MDALEMEDVIKKAGWTPIQRVRRKGNVYIYASKRQGAKMVERYIGPLSKIEGMTSEQIIAKLHPAG